MSEATWPDEGLYHVILADPDLEPTLTPRLRPALHCYLRTCIESLDAKLITAGGRPTTCTCWWTLPKAGTASAF
ncbi:MAG: hypothetical protein HC944_05955 [Nanoarchaeota archaeon]|nr:hypothetical protein [Nanoarchaeota archaeon]